jgi:hypothetical protein
MYVSKGEVLESKYSVYVLEQAKTEVNAEKFATYSQRS